MTTVRDTALLELDGLVAGYGELTVLRDVDLSIARGQVHCLMGRNGAGKSSLLGTILGIVRASRGRIMLDGEDITARPPHERPALGIASVPQGRRLFGELSVSENLDVAALTAGTRTDREFALKLFPVLTERLRQRADTLSGGEQQMLATARALCCGPRLLLMDEPTEGLQPSMIETIRQSIVTLRSRGVTIVLVEQRVEAVLPIADTVTFIENGRIEGRHAAAAVRADPSLLERHLGVG